MHISSLERMRWFIDAYLNESVAESENKRVLDVGSFDVNGTYKPLFLEGSYEYVGLDMVAGPNVDLVVDTPYRWPDLQTEYFDAVISGQALEHTEFFWETLTEMARVLKRGGLLCIIAPNGFAEHRYPVDCYRFFTDGMVALARYIGFEVLHAHTNRGPSTAHTDWFSDREADSMLIARKPYAGPAQIVNLNTYRCIPVNKEEVGAPLVKSPVITNHQPETFFGKRLQGLAHKLDRLSKKW